MCNNVKYANFLFSSGNLGDNVQIYALELIYERMGIDRNDIVRFTVENASEILEANDYHYILPMVCAEHLYWNLFDVIPFEQLKNRFTLLPISIGLTRYAFLDEQHLIKYRNIIDLYKTPIGCRDHDTAVMHESIGHQTYVNGCITNTFPRRKEGNYNTVFIIDIPESLLMYIPEHIKNKAKFVSNLTTSYDNSEYCQCVERYEYLRDNASLIITKRYHIAHPCYAMGIPVIFISEDNELRMSAVNPLIPCYTGDFDKIDWEPETTDFEGIKKSMISLISGRIRNAYNTASLSFELENFYIPSYMKYYDRFCRVRDKSREAWMNMFFYVPYLSKLKENFSFYLFGISNNGDLNGLLKYINIKRTDSYFMGFIDSCKTGTHNGYTIYSTDEFDIDDSTYVIVSALTANDFAEKIFKERALRADHLIKLPHEVSWFYYHGLLSEI